MPYKIVRRDGGYCVINSETRETKSCYETKREAMRLLRALYANVEDAQRAISEEERDEVYKRYHELVNMSASELERWANSECSKKASLTRAPIERNLHLLRTPKAQWGAKEIRWAKRTISFISRMRGAEQGEPAKDGCPSKRDISLMNWAHRPSANRADLVSLRFQKVACQRVRLEEIQHPERIWVLAMPFNVTDSYNTFFSQRTERRIDIVPEQVPVFDFHGLRGTEQDVQPIGKTLKWEKRDEGWWALVELDTTDPRAEAFMRAAAECNLEASVGMLRAGMYPQPPIGGVFEKPTELLQAPVSELSLIIPSETERAANEAAIGGYEFSLRKGAKDMCQDCNQNDAARADIESLRATIEALRAEMEEMKKAKEEAEKAAAAERAARRRDQYAQRMMQMSVPQSIVNELLDIFGDVPEGSQDRIIDVVGRLVDHVRAMTQNAPTDSQRAAPPIELRSMLTTQATNHQHALAPESKQFDEKQLELDREMIRSRLAAYNARNGAKA